MKEQVNAIYNLYINISYVTYFHLTGAIQYSKPLGTAVYEQNLLFSVIFILATNDFPRQKIEEFFLLEKTAVTEFLKSHFSNDQLFDLTYLCNYSCCPSLIRGCSYLTTLISVIDNSPEEGNL